MATSEDVVTSPGEQPVPVASGRILAVSARKVLARASGARLVYGKPVKAGNRTIIPVARVFSAGGFGFGGGRENTGSTGEGAGGGGVLDARPIGYIEIDETGSHFRAIPDPDRSIRLLKTVAGLVTAFGGTALGRRAVEAARRGARGRGGRATQPRGARRRPSPPRSRKR